MPIHLMPESVIDDAPNWTLAVNRNQNLLGKVMLAARRPVTSVVDLRAEEWLSYTTRSRGYARRSTRCSSPISTTTLS